MNKISVIQGDITQLKVDAIVNAANSSLMGGGGVDGAIHRAGGKEILEDCKIIVAKQGRLPTGKAVITTAGNLPAGYVIHTVGPVWHGGHQDEDEKLKDCYENSMKLAIENNCKTIAFPCISTGIYHFPKDRAAQIAVHTIKNFLRENKDLKEIILVCFDDENYNLIVDQVG